MLRSLKRLLAKVLLSLVLLTELLVLAWQNMPLWTPYLHVPLRTYGISLQGLRGEMQSLSWEKLCYHQESFTLCTHNGRLAWHWLALPHFDTLHVQQATLHLQAAHDRAAPSAPFSLNHRLNTLQRYEAWLAYLPVETRIDAVHINTPQANMALSEFTFKAADGKRFAAALNWAWQGYSGRLQASLAGQWFSLSHKDFKLHSSRLRLSDLELALEPSAEHWRASLHSADNAQREELRLNLQGFISDDLRGMCVRGMGAWQDSTAQGASCGVFLERPWLAGSLEVALRTIQPISALQHADVHADFSIRDGLWQLRLPHLRWRYGSLRGQAWALPQEKRCRADMNLSLLRLQDWLPTRIVPPFVVPEAQNEPPTQFRSSSLEARMQSLEKRLRASGYRCRLDAWIALLLMQNEELESLKLRLDVP